MDEIERLVGADHCPADVVAVLWDEIDAHLDINAVAGCVIDVLLNQASDVLQPLQDVPVFRRHQQYEMVPVRLCAALALPLHTFEQDIRDGLQQPLPAAPAVDDLVALELADVQVGHGEGQPVPLRGQRPFPQVDQVVQVPDVHLYIFIH